MIYNNPMKLGMIMDPIERITTKKDSSFAMLLAAQKRGWDLYYLQVADLSVNSDQVSARVKRIRVIDDPDHWFEVLDELTISLNELDAILMRKDPPFDMQYIYCTYLLELVENQGTAVFNKPASIRSANEKLFITNFPNCITETCVAKSFSALHDFIEQHDEVILKPLDGMGGRSIFKSSRKDSNLNVILETLTDNEQLFIMAQRYLPEIKDGDKRILLINGEPVAYALARIPGKNDARGNLARGATAEGRELTDRDRWLCEQIGPSLKTMGLSFVGLDVIGDYVTEINVTSPTCIRELDSLFDLDIAGDYIDFITSTIA